MSPSTLIKRLAASVLLLCSVLKAEDLYVRPSHTSGAHTGADWTNAWNGFSDVKWGPGAGMVGPGDTLWVAGGTYTTQLLVGTNGASGSRITINRVLASDAVPVAAAGWISSLDSQVVIDAGRVPVDELVRARLQR